MPLDVGCGWMLDVVGCMMPLDVGYRWMLDAIGCWVSLNAGCHWVLDVKCVAIGSWVVIGSAMSLDVAVIGSAWSLDVGCHWKRVVMVHVIGGPFYLKCVASGSVNGGALPMRTHSQLQSHFP